jgi:hypothetical protein
VKNIKKPHKLPVVCNIATQWSKGTKVAPKTIKMYQKGQLLFLYSYNTPILLTIKIIK